MSTLSSQSTQQNARTHGLTARRLPPRLAAEAEQLCAVFLADGPYTPELETAAREVADLTLLLSAIQGQITAEIARTAGAASVESKFKHWFETLPTPEGLTRGLRAHKNASVANFDAFLPTREEVDAWLERLKADESTPELERRMEGMRAVFLNPPRKLKSLYTYDRKARSRLAKAIQRMDYLRIETRRHS